MFQKSLNFNKPLDKWDMSNVGDRDFMFDESNVYVKIQQWNRSKVIATENV